VSGENLVVEIHDLIASVFLKYRDQLYHVVVDSISRDMSEYCDLLKYQVNSSELKLYFNCRNVLCVWVHIDMSRAKIVIFSSYFRPECREWDV
jgi:hypothetical protein